MKICHQREISQLGVGGDLMVEIGVFVHFGAKCAMIVVVKEADGRF